MTLLRCATLLTPVALGNGELRYRDVFSGHYGAPKLSVTLWRAKAARVRAEGGCANRHSPGAVSALLQGSLSLVEPRPSFRKRCRIFFLYGSVSGGYRTILTSRATLILRTSPISETIQAS